MNQNRHLFISSLLFTVLLIIWPFFMALSQPQGDTYERFQWILQNQALFKLQFFFAFLIAPAIIYMIVSQLISIQGTFLKTDSIGFIFLAAYLVFCNFSYGAQFVMVPKLIKQEMISIAHVFYFDSETSFTYFLNQTGYFFWALGILVLFSKHLSQKGPMKAIAVIYILSAVLSAVAFLGLITESKALNSMTFVSGIILLPVGILSIIWSLKHKP